MGYEMVIELIYSPQKIVDYANLTGVQPQEFSTFLMGRMTVHSPVNCLNDDAILGGIYEECKPEYEKVRGMIAQKGLWDVVERDFPLNSSQTH